MKYLIKNSIKEALEQLLEQNYGQIVNLKGMPRTFMLMAACDDFTKEMIIFSAFGMTSYTYLGTSTIADCKELNVPILDGLAKHLFSEYATMICKYALLARENNPEFNISLCSDNIRIFDIDGKLHFRSAETDIVIEYGPVYEMAENLLVNLK